MATAITDPQTPKGDAALVYGKRDNITVPGADQADAGLTAVETAAATRETDRSVTPGSSSGVFQPDAADYNATGSERS